MNSQFQFLLRAQQGLYSLEQNSHSLTIIICLPSYHMTVLCIIQTVRLNLSVTKWPICYCKGILHLFQNIISLCNPEYDAWENTISLILN